MRDLWLYIERQSPRRPCDIHINFCYSIHFRVEHKIEFRDVDDFNKILYSHSVASHTPTTLETIASSTLLYVDGSKAPFKVYRLDLSESKPKLAPEKQVIPTQQTFVEDMCFVHYGDKQLQVVAARGAGLFAYNAETNKLEWKVNGKVTGMEEAVDVRGITTDGRGHLFVADYKNECIYMFSTSEGQYLGRLMKGVETYGNPGRVYWSPETSTLVAACLLQDKWHLQLITIQ